MQSGNWPMNVNGQQREVHGGGADDIMVETLWC